MTSHLKKCNATFRRATNFKLILLKITKLYTNYLRRKFVYAVYDI